jgi:hypothetical protein
MWMRNSLVSYSFQLLSLGFFLVLAGYEYRALLRGREYYADVGAAFIVKLNPVRQVLESVSVSAQVTGLRKLLAFHPSSEQRKAVIRNPISLLTPSTLEIAFTGYLVGVILQILYVSGYLQGMLYDGTYIDYVKSVSSSLSNFVDAAIPLGLIFVCILVLGSQNLRYATSLGFGVGGFRAFAIRTIVSSVTLFVSMNAGAVINPKSLEVYLFTANPSIYYVEVIQFVSLLIAVILTSFVFGLFFMKIYPIRGLGRFSALARLACLFLWLYMAIQWTQWFMLLMAPSEAELDAIRIPLLIGISAFIAIDIVLLGSMAVVARLSLRRRVRPIFPSTVDGK